MEKLINFVRGSMNLNWSEPEIIHIQILLLIHRVRSQYFNSWRKACGLKVRFGFVLFKVPFRFSHLVSSYPQRLLKVLIDSFPIFAFMYLQLWQSNLLQWRSIWSNNWALDDRWSSSYHKAKMGLWEPEVTRTLGIVQLIAEFRKEIFDGVIYFPLS